MTPKSLIRGDTILVPTYFLTDHHPFGAARSWVEATVGTTDANFGTNFFDVFVVGGGCIHVPMAALKKCIRMKDIESLRDWETVENGGA